jgi:DNA-binding MarR family transcriptional regulator
VSDLRPHLPSKAEQAEVVEELHSIFGFHVSLANTVLKQHFQAHHGALNLTHKQIAILWLVGGCPGIVQSNICSWLKADRATVATMVQALAQKGLLKKHLSSADGRLVPMSLTEKGEQVLAMAKRAIAEHEAAILRGFSKEELAQAKSLLRKIHEAGPQ